MLVQPTCWCWSEKFQLWFSQQWFSPRFFPVMKKEKWCLDFTDRVHRLEMHKQVTWIATPKSLPSSIFGMRCWIQQETWWHRQVALDQTSLGNHSSIRHIWKLTTMMASLKATISGFTCSRSSMIFSLLLMKPHFGAEDKRKPFSQFNIFWSIDVLQN